MWMMHLGSERKDLTNLDPDPAILTCNWEGGRTQRAAVPDYNVSSTISSNHHVTPNSRADWNQTGKDAGSTEENFAGESRGNTINCPLP
jgi:hypothetical protein